MGVVELCQGQIFFMSIRLKFLDCIDNYAHGVIIFDYLRKYVIISVPHLPRVEGAISGVLIARAPPVFASDLSKLNYEICMSLECFYKPLGPKGISGH